MAERGKAGTHAFRLAQDGAELERDEGFGNLPSASGINVFVDGEGEIRILLFDAAGQVWGTARLPRKVAMWLACNLTAASAESIGLSAAATSGKLN